jgi:hypothetical protein
VAQPEHRNLLDVSEVIRLQEARDETLADVLIQLKAMALKLDNIMKILGELSQH